MRRRPWWWRARWLARRAKVELRQRAQDAGYWVRPYVMLEDRRVWRWKRPPHHCVVINHEPEGYEGEQPPDWADWIARQDRLAFEVEKFRARMGWGPTPESRFFAELEEDARRDR